MSENGRIISLSAKLSGTGLVGTAVRPPHERSERPLAPMSTEDVQAAADSALIRGTAGGLMLARILQMNAVDRLKALGDAVDDPVVIWFALLTKEQRAEIIKAAMGSITG